jgi:hypothetical protein
MTNLGQREISWQWAVGLKREGIRPLGLMGVIGMMGYRLREYRVLTRKIRWILR